jgi:hypothetical protein
MLKWEQANEISVNTPLCERTGEHLGIDTESGAVSDFSIIHKIREVKCILDQCNAPSFIIQISLNIHIVRLLGLALK